MTCGLHNHNFDQSEKFSSALSVWSLNQSSADGHWCKCCGCFRCGSTSVRSTWSHKWRWPSPQPPVTSELANSTPTTITAILVHFSSSQVTKEQQHPFPVCVESVLWLATRSLSCVLIGPSVLSIIYLCWHSMRAILFLEIEVKRCDNVVVSVSNVQ